MNLLCDFLLWATEACIILTFVFVAISVVMMVVSVLWLGVRFVFCSGTSQDSESDEITLLSLLVLLGLTMRTIFGGWSSDR